VFLLNVPIAALAVLRGLRLPELLRQRSNDDAAVRGRRACPVPTAPAADGGDGGRQPRTTVGLRDTVAKCNTAKPLPGRASFLPPNA
jgi:hypothetical protein